MKKNMGMIDRVVRVLLAILVVVFYLTGYISGTLAIVLLAFSAILIFTSLISTCPLYLPFGISTRKKESQKS
jgi:hypothetical protein